MWHSKKKNETTLRRPRLKTQLCYFSHVCSPFKLEIVIVWTREIFVPILLIIYNPCLVNQFIILYLISYVKTLFKLIYLLFRDVKKPSNIEDKWENTLKTQHTNATYYFRFFFIWMFYLSCMKTEPYTFAAVKSTMHIVLGNDLREGV